MVGGGEGGGRLGRKEIMGAEWRAPERDEGDWGGKEG